MQTYITLLGIFVVVVAQIGSAAYIVGGLRSTLHSVKEKVDDHINDHFLHDRRK